MFNEQTIYDQLIETKMDIWAPVSDWFMENGNDDMAFAILWSGNKGKYPLKSAWYVDNTKYSWYIYDRPFRKVKEDHYGLPLGVGVYMPKLKGKVKVIDAEWNTAKEAFEALSIGLSKAKEVLNV